jgi:toxin-antitoxin system PIN domain toxin
MSTVALLDVNVLIALFDPDHMHHEAAHDWFADYRADGWATCPLTENGLVRVLSHPRYGAEVRGVADVIERLRAFRSSGDHHFWPDEVSVCDEAVFQTSAVRGHAHVTDIYLVGLAVRRGGRLATFDRTIPITRVRGATRETLQVIAPAP